MLIPISTMVKYNGKSVGSLPELQHCHLAFCAKAGQADRESSTTNAMGSVAMHRQPLLRLCLSRRFLLRCEKGRRGAYSCAT